MIVRIIFTDGSMQESYGIRALGMADGHLILDRRRFPLARIASFTTAATATAVAPKSGPPVSTERGET